ncbi:MAG: hypothetical protein ACR2P5_05065 [Gammaproteobacteria bacterium]
MELWIPITLFAAVMQVARTGWQKSLLADLDGWAVTWLRFGFALPFAPLYLLAQPAPIPAPNAAFLAYTACAAAAQIGATAALVWLFSRRNFAVCTAFSKTEAVQIALLGALFFDFSLSAAETAGIALGAFGVLLLLPRGGGAGASFAGVAVGGGFALTALFLKKAVLHLDSDSPAASAALALFVMLFLQAFLLGAVLCWKKRLHAAAIWRVRRRALAVGVSSFLGSAGWLTAFALTHPALVKTLAQAELPLAYLLGRAAFSEKPRATEICGMLACAAAAIIAALA